MNTRVLNFMKIRTVGTELLRADGRTDMTRLVVTSRNFANAPKKWPYTMWIRQAPSPWFTLRPKNLYATVTIPHNVTTQKTNLQQHKYEHTKSREF